MRATLLALALLLSPLTPQAVAARCAGETSAGGLLCACTVRSRLAVGWAPSKVLNHYYAKSRKPTAVQVQQAKDGLAGVGCPVGAYYLFSKDDMRKLHLRVDCSVANAGGVWAFARNALKVCK
jgi:hypothetical protein